MAKAAELHPIVAFMANDPAMVMRLLTEHVSDRYGRCRVCVVGAQSGNQKWPCRLHCYAALARELLPDAKKPKRPGV